MNAVTYSPQRRTLSTVLWKTECILKGVGLQHQIKALDVCSKQKYTVYPWIHVILICPMQSSLINETLLMKSFICSVSLVESFCAHPAGFFIYISIAMILSKRNPPMQNKQNAMFLLSNLDLYGGKFLSKHYWCKLHALTFFASLIKAE